MKKETKQIIALLLLCIALCFADNAWSQTVVRDAKGNYTAVKGLKIGKEADKPTGNTYTDAKGIVYPVYVSDKGKVYVIRTSAKTGNQYRQYLKL